MGMHLIIFFGPPEAIFNEFIYTYERLSDFNLMLLQENMPFPQELYGETL
jgi:hypothetical protein